MVDRINRWHDGTFRRASSWKPELLNNLIDEQARLGASDEEMTRIVEDREIWFLNGGRAISNADWQLVNEVWQAHLEACDGEEVR